VAPGLAVDPEQLFEARRYLDSMFPAVAMQRATRTTSAPWSGRWTTWRAAREDPRAWMDANLRLHLAIARASRIEVLIGLYQTIVSVPQRHDDQGQFRGRHGGPRAHNMEVHVNLVAAIRDRTSPPRRRCSPNHHEDMIRVR